MRWAALIFAAGFMAAAPARALSSLEEVLTHPLQVRLSELKLLRPASYLFLAHVAADHTFGLQMRWRAITTMGRLDSVYFRKNLEAAMLSKEWFVRNAALIAEQTADRAHAVAWSARLLNDPALVVRTQAVRNLIRLNARETEPLLWRQIFSAQNFRGRESLWVRVHLAEALARFASPGHVRDFQRLLLDPDQRLYKWAVIGLENTTGLKTGQQQVPLEVRRQQWLERLGNAQI